MHDFRLVMIEWVDSETNGSWRFLDGDIQDRPLVCKSIGWRVLDGEHVKAVVPHIAEEQGDAPLQGCGRIIIPTCAVVKIYDIEFI